MRGGTLRWNKVRVSGYYLLFLLVGWGKIPPPLFVWAVVDWLLLIRRE